MCSRTKRSVLLYLMLLLTKRSQFLDFSFSFCRAARLIEMIQVSYFFAIRYHPGVKIVTCHSVSSRGSAPRFNLDNDQLPGSRPRHSHLLNSLPVRVSSWPRHSPGCRDEKCERGEKIPSWARSAGWGLFVYQLAGVGRISWWESHPIWLESPDWAELDTRTGKILKKCESPGWATTKRLETSQTFVPSIKIISRQTEHGNKRKWIGNQSTL